MSKAERASQRRATLTVLGILAIPFASVSSAALLAGPVSSADPTYIARTIAATLVGAATGLMIVRLLRAAVHGIHTAAMAAADWIASESLVFKLVPGTGFVVITSRVPSPCHHPWTMPRRGPPAGL